MDKIIACSSTSSDLNGKFGVIKAWLNLNHIEYDEDSHSAGCHYWTEIRYNLTIDQVVNLIKYLEAAGVLNEKNRHIII